MARYGYEVGIALDSPPAREAVHRREVARSVHGMHCKRPVAGRQQALG
jgi:hypothetical protein